MQVEEIHPDEQPVSIWRFVLDMLETVLLALVLFLGINAVSARVRVDGFSMRPTLQDGEYVLVNKLSYKIDLPARGDIVVFRFPMDPTQDFIKRVIGLPGDQVAIASGRVSVNGNVLNEPYIAAAPMYEGSWQVPADHLFVLGDNRNDSSDSHSWGVVPFENVVGKAILIYWPLADWSMIDHVPVAAAAP